MREVVILGVGLHPFGRFPEKGVEELARVAIAHALEEAGVPFKDIQAAYVGHVYLAMGAGLKVVTEFGMTGIPIVNMEVACTSSTQGLIRGAYEIATGLYDVVLAVGVEKMQRGLLAGTAQAGSFEEVMGFAVMPASYALKAQKHMKLYGTTMKQLALCSVKEHECGALNPNAHYQKQCSVEEVLNSRMIADPISLLMCSPTSDGASAAVICAKEKAREYLSKRPITIASWALTSQKYYKGEEAEFGAIKEVSKEAYEKAGIGPEDIDVAQVHDAFSPGEIFVPEALSFIPEGEGGVWLERGETNIGGKIPINTDGGLVARGHPVGATGLAQVAEIVSQLRGEAEQRQVPSAPKIGLCHNTGIGGTCVTILKR